MHLPCTQSIKCINDGHMANYAISWYEQFVWIICSFWSKICRVCVVINASFCTWRTTDSESSSIAPHWARKAIDIPRPLRSARSWTWVIWTSVGDLIRCIETTNCPHYCDGYKNKWKRTSLFRTRIWRSIGKILELKVNRLIYWTSALL